MKNYKKALLFLNGEINNYRNKKEIVINENYDYIIAIDGGANHLYKMKDIMPNYIIGDLDSITKEALEYFKKHNIEFKKFKSEKDETDTELGVLLCNSLNVQKIDIMGALGGRVDHTISNINILYYIRKLNIFPRIISDKEIIYLIENESINLEIKEDSIVSIIPVKDDAKGVTLKGFRYNLENFDIKFASPLGMSNVVKDKNNFIKVSDGSLLIIINTL